MVTARQLNRTALQRQFLLERQTLDPVAAVEHLVGLQAQDAASPYLSLWTRLVDFDGTGLDAAFRERRLVKASLMRITLHAVSAADYPAFYGAMAASLRGSRQNDRRFVPARLPVAAVDALLPDLAAYLGQPRTDAELEAWLATRTDGDASVAWWGLRTFSPNFRVPTQAPWSFPGKSYDAPRGFAPPPEEAGIPALLLRYLGSYGPATAHDFARFTLLRSPVVKKALAALGDRVEQLEGEGGQTLLDLPGAMLAEPDAPAPPRFLPMWDNLFLGHVDSARILAPDLRRVVVQQNGDILPTVLVDGWVAGVWRPRGDALEVTALRPLDAQAWSGLEREAARLLEFLAGRDPQVYARVGHWWDKGLPGVEVRLLGR